MKVKTVLKVENIVHYFREKPVLKDISFSLKEGDVLALIGENGSGKTTLLKTVAGIYKPLSGRVIFPEKEKKRRVNMGTIVSYLPQFPQVFTNFSVEYFLLLSRYPWKKGFSFSEKDFKLVDEIAEEYGIDKIKERGILNISGGELKRVLLAGAELQDSEVVLLDEPDSFLDPVSIKIVKSFIKRMKKKGKTLVFSTHNLSLVYEVADYVLSLKDGVVICFAKVKRKKLKEVAEDTFGVKFVELEHKKRLYFVPE